jgi:transposase
MQPIFKPHSVYQQELFSLKFNGLTTEDHTSRLIDRAVEKLNIPNSQYKGGRTLSYHPKMLLKILFYGYLKNTHIYTKLWRAFEEI